MIIMTLDYEELLKELTRFTRYAEIGNLTPLDFMYRMKWEGNSPYHSSININDESSILSINVNEEYNILMVRILDSVYIFDDLYEALTNLNKQACSIGKSVSDFLYESNNFDEVRFELIDLKDYYIPLLTRGGSCPTQDCIYTHYGSIRNTWDTLGRRKAVVLLP